MEILKEVTVEKGTLALNAEVLYKHESNDISLFLKDLYKHLKLGYSKFYKMDYLSKLGFLCSEILLDGYDEFKESDQIAIVIANKSSSLNTDITYQSSIAEVPSPSVFVYTLPNIVIGEISIRHKLYGEHLFLVQEKYNEEQLRTYAQTLLETTQTSLALVAWLEVSAENEYGAKMMLLKNI